MTDMTNGEMVEHDEAPTTDRVITVTLKDDGNIDLRASAHASIMDYVSAAFVLTRQANRMGDDQQRQIQAMQSQIITPNRQVRRHGGLT